MDLWNNVTLNCCLSVQWKELPLSSLWLPTGQEVRLWLVYLKLMHISAEVHVCTSKSCANTHSRWIRFDGFNYHQLPLIVGLRHSVHSIASKLHFKMLRVVPLHCGSSFPVVFGSGIWLESLCTSIMCEWPFSRGLNASLCRASRLVFHDLWL